MSTKQPRRAIALLLALTLALAVVVAGCGDDDSGGGSVSSDEPYEMTVELNWLPGTDHIGLLTALEHGYFEDENLDVEYLAPPDGAAALKFVAANKVDLAISFGPEVLIAAGQGLPVTAVGSHVPVPLASLVALPDAGIDGPEDLAGKRVGNSGIPKEDAMAKAIFEEAGIEADDVELVNVGFNLVPVALDGKVDALLGAFSNGTAVDLAYQSKEDPVVIPVDEIGVPTYDELVLVANSNRLKDDEAYADAVKRFNAAMEKGYETAIAEPRKTEDVVIAAMDDLPSGKEEVRMEVQTSIPLLTPPDGRPLGCFDTAAWQEFGQWMEDNDLVKNPVDTDAVISNDYNEACASG
jgi:putative hydroxymethylpyrimidine transport system substrate-binding protein